MNIKNYFRVFFGVLSIISLSNCSSRNSANEPRIQFAETSSTSSSTTVTSTTLCSPAPSAQAYALGTVTQGVPTVIRFTGWGMCNFRFRVVGFQGVSSNQSLDITDVFNFAGANQVRQYSLQLVDGSGNPVGNYFSTVLNLIVNEPTTTTWVPATTTTTTLVAVTPPSCTLERVVDSTHPATSSSQQSIWVRFQTYGTSVTSSLNGYSVGSGIYEIRTSNFPFFEMQGNVSNRAGTNSCRLSVATSYCLQTLVGPATATSVTTELTALGSYDTVYIQGVRQIGPPWLLPWVTYTETFASSTVARTRETTGSVQTSAGDSWSCPVTYLVPAGAAPAPVYSNFMNMGEFLYAGNQLVPSGSNICGCRAVMQGDGNFVVYRGNRALWSSHTYNNPGAFFAFQTDGNMVVYKGSTPKWSSATNRRGAWQLHMQGDCNLVLYTYNFSSALWSSHSAQSGCY